MLLSAFILASCGSSSKHTSGVNDFEVEKYMGTWYEIARMDFKFEKDLNNVSAQYNLDDKGNVIVTNSGYHTVKEQWEKAVGKAKFRGNNNIGELKVSFFGPFYSDYNVSAIDEDYRYALVTGKNQDYIWILSRSKSIPDDIKGDYLEKAKTMGYNTDLLIWVQHDKDDNPFLNEK